MAGEAGGGMTGGEMANIIGNSLLGYFVGKKAQERQGEIAGTSAALSDPFAKQRGYYQSILGQLYGMPEGYGEATPESGEPTNEFEKLYASLANKFGGGAQGGGAGLGALLGGGGGMITGGLLGRLTS